MPGVKGSGGPPPKRSEQRRRRNKTAAEEKVGATSKAPGVTAAAPPADDEWHAVARAWYESLATSGQSAFYQASDWGAAFVLAEAISRELSPQPMIVGAGDGATVEMHSMPMKGATLSAFLKGCTALLVTEGDRRRAAVELQRPTEGDADASVTSIDAWRGRSAL